MTINGRPEKAAMLVAQRIIRDVGRDDIQPGQLLPPERILLEKYQIGRGTLREALRLLEFQGVISLKPGPGGGPVLLVPDPSHLASSLRLLMQLKAAPFRAIVEVRTALEPVASLLAANRMDDAALEDLAASVKEMRDNINDQVRFFETNRRFHDVIAWGSSNALLGYFVESLLGIMDGTFIGISYPVARRRAILKAHEEIYQALKARDADEAQARMRDHLEGYVAYAERKFPEVLDRIIQWDRPSR